MSGLARELLKLKMGAPLGYTTGVVTDTSPFTVRVGGVDVPEPPRLASYAPAVDDVVFVLRPDTGFLVLGNIV